MTLPRILDVDWSLLGNYVGLSLPTSVHLCSGHLGNEMLVRVSLEWSVPTQLDTSKPVRLQDAEIPATDRVLKISRLLFVSETELTSPSLGLWLHIFGMRQRLQSHQTGCCMWLHHKYQYKTKNISSLNLRLHCVIESWLKVWQEFMLIVNSWILNHHSYNFMNTNSCD